MLSFIDSLYTYTNPVLKLHWCSKYYIQFFSDGPVSKFLKWVKVPIITNSQCRNTELRHQLITEDMICAGYANGGKDACSGDSGGPLICQNGKYAVITGIISWGIECALENYPGVYTRVPYFLQWIKKNMVSCIIIKSFLLKSYDRFKYIFGACVVASFFKKEEG